MSDINEMKSLIKKLNEASIQYYKYDKSIMTNKEFDDLYDKLLEMENDLKITLSNSPTVNVGGYLLESLPVVKHAKPMLSSNKTKSEMDIDGFISIDQSYASWKMDGITLVLTYDGGNFEKAVTRGNGEYGEDVTEQARTIKNIPLIIPNKNRIVVRGEAVISYKNFEDINSQITEEKEKYKNPRNLVSGSIRQLNTKTVSERNIDFILFECVSGLFNSSKNENFKELESIGFTIVPRHMIKDSEKACDVIKMFDPDKYEYPVDGIMFEYDDCNFSELLGSTNKYENCRIALKWEDEVYKTILRDIEWYTSRSGLVNPVAVFDKVDIDGAGVSRATLHNLSILESFKFGIGDEIEVYRANKVIPQVYRNITQSNTYIPPRTCPMCGSVLELTINNDTKTLKCTNKKNCKSAIIDSITYFASRDGMDIKGLGESAVNDFVDLGIITSIEDLYNIDIWNKNKIRILSLKGWGELAFNNLLDAIENSKDTTMPKFLTSLGIPFVGRSICNKISRYCGYDINKFLDLYENMFNWAKIDTIGEVISNSINKYLDVNIQTVRGLSNIMNFKIDEPPKSSDLKLLNKTFVITGTLNKSSRNDLKILIESLGGKVVSGVTKKVDFLINNDIESTSSKNKEAKAIGVNIINEDKFYEMVGE